MSKFSPEIEAIITTIIYLDCRMEAILRLLEDKGILLDSKELASRTHRINSIQTAFYVINYLVV
jgi:hypothetical protein